MSATEDRKQAEKNVAINQYKIRKFTELINSTKASIQELQKKKTAFFARYEIDMNTGKRIQQDKKEEDELFDQATFTSVSASFNDKLTELNKGLDAAQKLHQKYVDMQPGLQVAVDIWQKEERKEATKVDKDTADKLALLTKLQKTEEQHKA